MISFKTLSFSQIQFNTNKNKNKDKNKENIKYQLFKNNIFNNKEILYKNPLENINDVIKYIKNGEKIIENEKIDKNENRNIFSLNLNETINKNYINSDSIFFKNNNINTFNPIFDKNSVSTNLQKNKEKDKKKKPIKEYFNEIFDFFSNYIKECDKLFELNSTIFEFFIKNKKNLLLFSNEIEFIRKFENLNYNKDKQNFENINYNKLKRKFENLNYNEIDTKFKNENNKKFMNSYLTIFEKIKNDIFDNENKILKIQTLISELIDNCLDENYLNSDFIKINYNNNVKYIGQYKKDNKKYIKNNNGILYFNENKFYFGIFNDDKLKEGILVDKCEKMFNFKNDKNKIKIIITKNINFEEGNFCGCFLTDNIIFCGNENFKNKKLNENIKYNEPNINIKNDNKLNGILMKLKKENSNEWSITYSNKEFILRDNYRDNIHNFYYEIKINNDSYYCNLNNYLIKKDENDNYTALYFKDRENFPIFIGKIVYKKVEKDKIFSPINDKDNNNNIIIYPNDHLYIGNFLNENYLIKNGYGIYLIKNLDIFIKGNFNKDFITDGKLYYKNLKYFKGNLENNLIKKGFIFDMKTNEKIFEGELNENLEYHGNDIMFKANNLLFNGNFENGKKQGSFTIINEKNKKIYENIIFKDDILEKVNI